MTAVVAAPPQPGEIATPIFEFTEVFQRTLYWSLRGRQEPGAVLRSAYEIGNRSLFFLSVTMGFIGMILVYQSGLQALRVVPDLTLLGATFLELLVRDLGSTNGTRVDGVRISEGAWQGDIDLALGSVQLRLRERGGLDALALALGADAAAPAAPAADQPTAAPTVVQNQLRELRQSLEEGRPDAPGPWSVEALARVLQRWREFAEASALRLQRGDGDAVLAQAGAAPAQPEAAGAGRSVRASFRCPWNAE